MKVIIQIPCYNEAETLGVTLAALPSALPGVDEVEWLVIDDGSTDGTAEVARRHGVDHVVSLPANQGLAKAFVAGIEACLQAGADVIVNTDADNQYCADDIHKLVTPILECEAGMVVGERPIGDTEHFSMTKKFLQRIGSRVVRAASQTDVADAPSGFRAISRDAALQLNVFSEYTYTLETIIQLGQSGVPVKSVPIRTNEDLRPSRLVKSIGSYVRRSIMTILRIFMVYRPLRFFAFLGSIPFIGGLILCIRWLIYFAQGMERTRSPSLILAAILIVVAGQLWTLGLVADLMAANRKMLENIKGRVRRFELGDAPPHRSGPRVHDTGNGLLDGARAPEKAQTPEGVAER